MRRLKDRRRLFLLTAALALLLAYLPLAAPAYAAGPPELRLVDSQVTVKQDGSLDVKYRLTFHELDARDRINTLGPLDPGHKLLDAHIEHDGKETDLRLSSKGSGFYAVPFGFNTQPGKDYTVHIHYTVPSGLDQTVVDGVNYRVLAWSPVQWSLPIEEQVVRYILPYELPADVKEAEQVTDELVDQSRIIVNESTIKAFDRWVYYPTPDETTGKVWLSIYISKKDVPSEYHFLTQVFVPEDYLDIPRPTAQPEPADAFTPTTEPEPTGFPWIWLIVFLGLGLGLALLIVVIAFKRATPKAAPEGYEAPEIEVETFEQPGLVPDLDAIEAALYIGNSTKALTLVLMALEQKGVVHVLNYKPLQMEVLPTDQTLEDYEQILADGIAPDGTLPQATVDKVLAAISARLQTKMWNADFEATRQTYHRRAEEAWEEYRRLPPVHRPIYVPWIILSDGYRDYHRTRPATVSAGPRLADAVRESPMVAGADRMATMMEGVAGDISTKAEGLATSATDMLDRWFGKDDAGYDACHSACHSACVSGGAH